MKRRTEWRRCVITALVALDRQIGRHLYRCAQGERRVCRCTSRLVLPLVMALLPVLLLTCCAVTTAEAGSALSDAPAGVPTQINAGNGQNGTLVIIIKAMPNGPTAFYFTLTGQGLELNFALDDDSDPTFSNTARVSVAPGVFAVSQQLPLDWMQTATICSNGSPVEAIVVNAGDMVTCTFINHQELSTAVSVAHFGASAPPAFGAVAAPAGLAALAGTLRLFVRRRR